MDEAVKATSNPKRKQFFDKVDEIEDIAIGIEQSLSEFRDSIGMYCVDKHSINGSELIDPNEIGVKPQEQESQFETRLRDLKARLGGIQSQVGLIQSEFRG